MIKGIEILQPNMRRSYMVGKRPDADSEFFIDDEPKDWRNSEIVSIKQSFYDTDHHEFYDIELENGKHIGISEPISGLVTYYE